jgi:hypothetical protein
MAAGKSHPGDQGVDAASKVMRVSTVPLPSALSSRRLDVIRG